MAIIYYPNSSFILQRTTSGSVYTEIVTSTVPNSIFFFDSASQLAAISASTMYVTSSWAISASWAPGGGSSASSSWASSSISSSYAQTASYALNGGSGGSSVSASWASSSLTASSIYVPSGSGAWRMYVDTSGDLVFNFA